MNPNQPQYPPPGSQPAPAGAGRGLSFAQSDVTVGGAAFLFLVFSFTPLLSAGPLHTDLWNFTSPLGWWVAVANVLLLATAVAAHTVAARQGVRRLPPQPGAGRARPLRVLVRPRHPVRAALDLRLGRLADADLFSLLALAGAVLGHLGMLQDEVAIPTGRTSTPAAAPTHQVPAGGYTPPQAQGGYQPPATNYTPGQAPAQPPHQDDTI